jgi:hypothetical protein
LANVLVSNENNATALLDNIKVSGPNTQAGLLHVGQQKPQWKVTVQRHLLSPLEM